MAMFDRRNVPWFAAIAAFVLVLAFGKAFGSNSGGPGIIPSKSPTPATSSTGPTPKVTHTGGKVASTTTPPATPTTQAAPVPLTVNADVPLVTGVGNLAESIPAKFVPDERNPTPVFGSLSLLPTGANSPGATWNLMTDLPVGTYQVCLQLSTLKVTDVIIDGQPSRIDERQSLDWSCAKVRVASPGSVVTFTLGTTP